MDSLTGVVRLLRNEQDRLTKELRGIGAALAAFGQVIRKGSTQKAFRISSGTDRGSAKSALGKG